MATFSTKKVLNGPAQLIPTIANSIGQEFQNEGYQVNMDALSSGGYDISITKGGLFKAVLGMKTALKITLLPTDGCIQFEAGVGIWGQQAVPTIISMLFFWPVIITQISGMISQSKLDDKALAIAEDIVLSNSRSARASFTSAASGGQKFCTSCGTPNPMAANFCANCGKAV